MGSALAVSLMVRFQCLESKRTIPYLCEFKKRIDLRLEKTIGKNLIF